MNVDREIHAVSVCRCYIFDRAQKAGNSVLFKPLGAGVQVRCVEPPSWRRCRDAYWAGMAGRTSRLLKRRAGFSIVCHDKAANAKVSPAERSRLPVYVFPHSEK